MTDTAAALAPIRVESAPLRLKIIEAMRGALESGALEPGERLKEKELCEQLGVSRTSLREALRELEAIGVVGQAAGRGLTVVRIARRDAENIYAMRAEIEALLLAQFVERADDPARERALALCDELVDAYRRGDFLPIAETKRRFTEHLCAVADNRIAREFLSWLTLRTAQLRSRSVVRPDRQRESIREIEALRAALAAGDAAAAAKAARTHVQHAARSALPFAAA